MKRTGKNEIIAQKFFLKDANAADLTVRSLVEANRQLTLGAACNTLQGQSRTVCSRATISEPSNFSQVTLLLARHSGG